MDLCLSALHTLARIQVAAPQLVRPLHLVSWVGTIAYISRAFTDAEGVHNCSEHASPSTGTGRVLASLAAALALTVDHMAAMGPRVAGLPPARLELEELAAAPSLQLCAGTVGNLCLLSISTELQRTLEAAPLDACLHTLCCGKLFSAARSMFTVLQQYEPMGSPMQEALMPVLLAAASKSDQECEVADWDCTWMRGCLAALLEKR